MARRLNTFIFGADFKVILGAGLAEALLFFLHPHPMAHIGFGAYSHPFLLIEDTFKLTPARSAESIHV